MAADTDALARIRALPSWLLGRAAVRGHRLVAQALAGAGLRMTHHAVLTAVAELGPLSQAELGRTLRIDPKDMVAIVSELQADGLVTRTPDPGDRRKNAVAISAAGRQRLRRSEELAQEANEALIAVLAPAEREQLISLLRRIASPEEPCGTDNGALDSRVPGPT